MATTSRAAALAGVVLLSLAAEGQGANGAEPRPASPPASAATEEVAAPDHSKPARGAPAPTVVAAGDISPGRIAGQQETSDLVLRLDPTRVLALGDTQYPTGALADFRDYYAPTWGRFKARTKPAPGNHEYGTAGAAGYFSYFGRAARPAGRSYYSFDLPGWHLISLDSNIDHTAGSAQVEWLRADLRRSSRRCVLAFWHHPRFSSGAAPGNDTTVLPFWRSLYRHRTDLVLNGHEHNYERFAAQTPGGVATRRGIREFVVGTGGASHYGFGDPRPNSQARVSNTYGVLRLVLRPRSYLWTFVSVRGEVLDSGGPRRCH
jgi:hypothetical protein